MIGLLALGVAVVAGVALAVGLYPPSAALIGSVVVFGSIVSAVYLFRIYRRSPRPILFQALISLVIGVSGAGAWLIAQQAIRGITGQTALPWAYPINVGIVAALLAIPIYWAGVIWRVRRAE